MGVQGELAREQRHVAVGHDVRVGVRQERAADALVLGLDEHAVQPVLVRLHHHYAEVELPLRTYERI